MKTIYMPGMSITKSELQKIIELFRVQGMPVIPLMDEYLYLSKMRKKDIQRFIIERIDFINREHDSIHLICHSMGCNLGVLASQHSSVKNLTLVSPEFRSISRLEREEIIKNTAEKYQHEQQEKPLVRSMNERLLLVSLFLRSRKWALKNLNSVNVPIQIFYAEGDHFVSRKQFDELFDYSICRTMIETSNHNPFLSEKGPQLVKKIKQYYGE